MKSYNNKGTIINNLCFKLVINKGNFCCKCVCVCFYFLSKTQYLLHFIIDSFYSNHHAAVVFFKN